MVTLRYDRDSPEGREARKRALALAAAFISEENRTIEAEVVRIMNLAPDELAATIDALGYLARNLAVAFSEAAGRPTLDVLSFVEAVIDDFHEDA